MYSKKFRLQIHTLLIIAFIFFLILNFSSEHCLSQGKDSLETGKDSLEYKTEDVIISGTRTFKKIIDIPFSVERVGKDEFKYNRNISAKDILADVPGLFIQSRYGNHDVRISVRGFGTRSNSGIRGIRILQDGIPESDADGETTIEAIDMTSLGAVEVAKGNLSSLYTNAPGGVINFISDLSFAKNYVTSINEIGDFDLKQNGGKVGLLSKNYKFFLSYTYRNLTGYRQHSNEYMNIVNSVFDSYLGSNTTLSVLGNFAKGINKIPGSLTLSEYDSDPFQARQLAVSQDFKRDVNKGRLGVRFKTSFGKNNNNEFEVTGYGAIKDLITTDKDFYNFINRYVLGSTFRYVNKYNLGKRENEFSVGLDYFYQTGPVSSYENLNGHKGLSLQGENERSLNNLGVYIFDQVNIIKKKMDFLITGRYDRINFASNDLQFTGQFDTNRVFDKFTPKVALNYKITPDVALYTNYGFGFDTPSSSELSNYPYSSNLGRTTVNPDLKPQTSRNFELGIKGNLSSKKREIFEKIIFDLTFYNSKVDDEIIPFVVFDKTFYRNAARTNRTGLELGFKSEVTEGLEWVVNYIYSDLKYDQYSARVYDINGNFVDLNYSGNIVPSVPKNVVNFILTYEYYISKYFRGIINIDADHIGKMYVNDANSESTSNYTYFNSLAGVSIAYKNFDALISGGVNNIGNKKFVSFININDINQRYYEPGEPRSYYVNMNLSYKF